VITLRLLVSSPVVSGHRGELLSCAYTADSAFVLSGGWDGHLRLWEASSGAPVSALHVGPKPVTACALSPSGKQWLSGTLEGLLASWEPLIQTRVAQFLAHTRPISAICYAPDGMTLATASWDKTLMLWSNFSNDAEGRPLSGHGDVVAGCRFLPDGKRLLSWSHDGTLRVWDVRWAREISRLTGHRDRVTAVGISPDGSLILSASRDQTLILWDLASRAKLCHQMLTAEVRACSFLLDGQRAVTANAQGDVVVHAVPTLEREAHLETGFAVQCADLAPCGDRMVLGCADGQARFLALDGVPQAPLVTTAVPGKLTDSSLLRRLLGRGGPTHSYSCTCPACRHPFDLPESDLSQPASCPNCRRSLRVSLPV
jgi:WD40 repeat protein